MNLSVDMRDIRLLPDPEKKTPYVIIDLSKTDAQALAATLRSQGHEVISRVEATEAGVLLSA